MPPDIAERTTPPRLVGLVGGGLFLAGATLTAVALVLPRFPLDTAGFWVICALQLVLGVVLLASTRVGQGTDRWVAPLVVFGSIAVIGFAFALGAEQAEAAVILNVFYVWPAIYAGYFFSRAVALGVLVLIIVAYIVSSAVADVAGREAFIRGMITISVVAGTGIVAHAVRRHVDGLIRRLDELARIDPLTELLNRRGFDEQLSSELSRFHRTGQALSLAIGDLDRFKAVNDQFGHAAGDAALQEIGRALLSSARGADIVARIGGEEFALLMPATEPQATVEALERLRSAIATVTDPAGGSLAITFGVTSTEEAGCVDADSLLLAADRALYLGKARGGDQTVLYEAGMSHEADTRPNRSANPLASHPAVAG